LISCCGRPIRRNSVLEELRVKRLAVIQEHINVMLFVDLLDADPGILFLTTTDCCTNVLGSLVPC